MHLPELFKSKICWVVTAVVVLAIVIGLAVGLSRSSSSAVKGSMLVKTRSLLQVHELNNDKFSTIVDEPVYGIVTFDAHPERTVYYTTTKPGGGINSSANEKYQNITQYAKDWTITALAVDYVNDKLFVLDSVDASLYVMDTEGKYYKTITNNLKNPIDIVLDPYERLLFVLQESSILQIDGFSVTEVVTKSHLKALTIDRPSKTLYYSTSVSIESYNYSSKDHTTVIPRKVDIPSLAVIDNILFFLEVTKITSKPLPLRTILNSCQLINGICRELKTEYNDDTLQSIKKFEKEILSKANPCNEKNGGCEHLCILLSDKTTTCLCNEGWKLKNDNTTCTKNT